MPKRPDPNLPVPDAAVPRDARRHASPSPGDLLVALHADRDTGRAAACRLGESLESWGEYARGPAPGARALAELAHRLGVPGPVLRRTLEILPSAARRAGEERRRAEAAGGRLVTRLDPGYPRPLLDLPLPPPVLAVAGEIPPPVTEAGLAVAMVGARRADAYGLEAAAHLARSLGALGLPVVSGFARGVDTASHRAALDGGGTTVAVLGCGLDVDYPRGNRKLGRRIRGAGGAAPGGALVSEFPCGAGPKPWHFPVRNRIIAALSLGTVVVRAARRSGSLITARLALDLGREVLAVPGPVFDRLSAGPHHLLADGAGLATSARDVLDALLGPSGAWGLLERGEELARQAAAAGGAGEGGEGGDDAGAVSQTSPALAGAGAPKGGLPAKLLAAMPVGRERSPEALADDLDAGVDAVLAALLELELTGWVRRFPGPAYARRAERVD